MLTKSPRPSRNGLEGRSGVSSPAGREDLQRQLVIQVRDRVVADLRAQGDMADLETIRRAWCWAGTNASTCWSAW